MNNIGFVYLFYSLDSKDNVFKIGFTKNTPTYRLLQLNNAAYPEALGFELLCYGECEKPKIVESQFHNLLKAYQIPSTELFKVDIKKVISYFFYYDNWLSFCDHQCTSILGIDLSTLNNPYEENLNVF